MAKTLPVDPLEKQALQAGDGCNITGLLFLVAIK